MKQRKLAAAIAACALTTSISPNAFSQEDPSEGAFALEEVIVTAQRKAESLQQAAIPINAVTGDRLLEAGVSNADGLNSIAPSLYVSNAGGATQGYFVRGVGNFTNNGFSNPAVAFNQDGVYIGRTSSTVTAFLDLNRVEVLKGPQGTLYGRNATGGAINVIPNAPELGENSSNITLELGNYDHYQVSGMTNIAVNATTALRFAGSYADREGYMSDNTSTAEDTALRAQLLTEPSENVSIRVSADYATQEGTGSGVHVHGAFSFAPFSPDLPVPNWAFTESPNSDPFTGLFSPDVLDFIENNVTAAPLFSPVFDFARPSRNDTYYGINSEINIALGEMDLVMIPAYRYSELDNVFSGPPFRSGIQQDEAEQLSFETRLSGETGAVEWILGAFYFDESVEGVNQYNQFATASHLSYEAENESWAAFARATFNISDSVRLVTGIRYTEDSREIEGLSLATAFVCLDEPPAGPPSCPDLPTIPTGLTLADSLSQIDQNLFLFANPLAGDLSAGGVFPVGTAGAPPRGIVAITPTPLNLPDDEDETTYRVGLEFDASEDSLLYVSFETGYRSGGFNLSKGHETYDPEYIDAYTIGSKNRLMGGRLELNLEAFYWEYEDQQLAALGIDSDGNNSFYTRNVGASTIQGVEIDFQFLATESTLIRGAIQYLDSAYDSFEYTQVDLSDETDPPNFLTPVTGCNYEQVMAPVREFDIDCSGKDALYSPELTYSLGLQKTFALDTGDVVLNLDYRFRDERYVGFNYIPGSSTGSTSNVDGVLSYKSNDGWTVSLYGRNLTDEEVPITYQVGAGNIASSQYEPPRTYGLRLDVDF